MLTELSDLSKTGLCVKRPRGWQFNIGDATLVYVLNELGPAISLEARVVWFKDDEIGLQTL